MYDQKIYQYCPTVIYIITIIHLRRQHASQLTLEPHLGRFLILLEIILGVSNAQRLKVVVFDRELFKILSHLHNKINKKNM